MNSGTTLNLWSLNTRADKIATLLGTSLGFITTNHTTLIEQLRNVIANLLHSTAMTVGWSVSNANRFLEYTELS